MADDKPPSSFHFQWGNINLEVKGSDELVEQGFDLVRNEILARIDQIPAGSGEAEDLSRGDERTPEGRDEVPTPAEYVEAKQPSSNIERATVLTHYAREYRDQDTMTGEQLERLINEARLKMFSAQDALYNASRKNRGWTKLVGTGTYELTPAGVSFVEIELPEKNG